MMVHHIQRAVLLILLGLFPALHAQGQVLLLKGGRVAAPDGTCTPADVLIKGDLITEIGTDLAAPEGANVLDLEGRVVAAAYIDAGNTALLDSHVRSQGGASAAAYASDMLEAGQPFARLDLLRAGIGAVYVDMALDGRSYAGPTGCVALTDPSGMMPQVVEAAAGATYRIGDSNARTASVAGRASTLKTLSAALSAGERHKKAWDKYREAYKEYEKKLEEWKKGGSKEKKPKKEEPKKEKPRPSGRRRPRLPPDFRKWPPEKQREWFKNAMSRDRGGANSGSKDEGGSKGGDGKPTPPDKPALNPGGDTWLRILDREVPLRVEAHWKEDIELTLKIQEEHDLRLVLIGATEAYRLVDELKEHEVQVILGTPMKFGSKSFDDVTAREDLAQVLAAAGIPVAFKTAGVSGFRYDSLEWIAGLHESAGMAQKDAFRAKTQGAAELIGMADELGSVEVGKRAVLQVRGSELDDWDSKLTHMIYGSRVVKVGGHQ